MSLIDYTYFFQVIWYTLQVASTTDSFQSVW